MKHTRPGPQALKEFLERAGGTQSGFAQAMGLDPAVIHNWVTGKRRPSIDQAHAIEKATFGVVRMKQWVRPETE